MSLVELAVTMVLMFIVGGSVIMVTQSSSRAYNTASRSSSIEQQANRALQRVKGLLKESGVSVITPTPAAPLNTSTVDFQRSTGVATWGQLERIQFEYLPGEADDGLDNNNNGLVDEGRLVWIQDPGGANEQRIVLCNWVSELLERENPNGLDDNANDLIDETGFCLVFDGNSTTIRLTLQRLDSQGTLLTSTVESTITFRN